MNYRHIYHAGNAADVFKHIILIILIKFLQKKETPLFYLDTHAGLGRYDLASLAAQKTKEYEAGIGRILKINHKNKWLDIYLQIIAKMNDGKNMRFYPGSPFIISNLLRQNDRMVLIELHPDDSLILQQEFKNNKQAAVHLNDGYSALKAFLPPKEKRGLILIDPPFEETNEFEQIIAGLDNALSRFRNGVYAVWYPIKQRQPIKIFHEQIEKLCSTFKIENKLFAELNFYPDAIPERLNGCGMVIINTPWQADLEINKIVTQLQQIF